MNKLRTSISLFLSIILVTGTITALSFMIDAQAQPSYTNNNYKSKDNTNVNLNKIKCNNNNININGINSGDVNAAGNKGIIEGNLDAYSSGGYDNNKQGKGFDDCIINNNNTNTNIVSVSGGNQTVPPEPTTATLTVKKQVFGCNTFPQPFIMDCTELQNDSSAWINCNNNINPDFNRFCQSLPESIFDIEVLDDQNNQIQQFVGSEQGTTIQNLEPGTHTVNEIKSATSITNQLGVNSDVEAACISAGFTDGGRIDNSTSDTAYSICFEYEDEQDNDCSTITLAAGEERTCTVKNYIFSAVQD